MDENEFTPMERLVRDLIKENGELKIQIEKMKQYRYDDVVRYNNLYLEKRELERELEQYKKEDK